jgi:hypothetical protein
MKYPDRSARWDPGVFLCREGRHPATTGQSRAAASERVSAAPTIINSREFSVFRADPAEAKRFFRKKCTLPP